MKNFANLFQSFGKNIKFKMLTKWKYENIGEHSICKFLNKTVGGDK